MNLMASAPYWLTLLLIFLLSVAALEDMWRLQISDWLSAGVALGAFLALAIGGSIAGFWQNLLLFALVLGLGTLLFVRNWMGGGDVKMLAAASLWFDLDPGGKMLVAVALAGGIETMVVMILRHAPWPQILRSRLAVLRPREAIPYGVAIAAGVIFAGTAAR